MQSLTQSAANRKYSFKKLAEYALEHENHSNHVEAAEKIIQLLLDRNVNINHKDGVGNTPLDLAHFYGKNI